MSAEREAALAALRAAEAVLAAEEAAVGAEPVREAHAPAAPKTAYLNMGPTYLGSTAINGT